MKNFNTWTTIILSLLVSGCQLSDPGREITGPEPPPTVKLISSDTITVGNYRGIIINSTNEEAFTILEGYREQKLVTYMNAVNNYFSDITELKNRIHLFEYVSFDQKFDTESGVQLQLESGKVKNITLNNRRELKQWPENVGLSEAVQIGDGSDVLYNKLVAFSKQAVYADRFGRITLSTPYTYAVYDPEKAALPWNIIYWTQADLGEEVRIHFKDKQVHYITVNRFGKI